MAGKTFEELYGEDKAREIKELISAAGKGKTLNLSDEERLARSDRVSGDNNPIHKLTEEENKDRIEKLKRTLSEYYSNNDGKNKGKVCYTDGKINIFLEKDIDPPEGFYKGRAKQETVECPHCDKVGPKPQMKQWHFDKCKQKETNK